MAAINLAALAKKSQGVTIENVSAHVMMTKSSQNITKKSKVALGHDYFFRFPVKILQFPNYSCRPLGFQILFRL